MNPFSKNLAQQVASSDRSEHTGKKRSTETGKSGESGGTQGSGRSKKSPASAKAVLSEEYSSGTRAEVGAKVDSSKLAVAKAPVKGRQMQAQKGKTANQLENGQPRLGAEVTVEEPLGKTGKAAKAARTRKGAQIEAARKEEEARSAAVEAEIPEPEAPVDLKMTWQKICARLESYLSAEVCKRWFQSARLVKATHDSGVISVGSDMQQIWVEANYLDELRAAFAEGADIHCVPEIIVQGQEVPKKVEPEKITPAPTRKERPKALTFRPVVPALEKRLEKLGVNPALSFQSFVVGPNSQFAHSACTAVAAGDGQNFNPLFIHGNPGLGKTHLMSAIAHEMMAENPRAKIAFTTAEQFANEFIEAVRKAGLEQFRKKYRSLDMLLIDDIQFLGGKERTQDEFFHTFSTLLNTRTQIVLTSDRPAHEITRLEPRLVSRFESGLTVELEVPAFETRVAILKRKMEIWKMSLDVEIVHRIASHIKRSVRRLEGALTRIGSYAMLAPEAMSITKVDELLVDLTRDENASATTINEIQSAVCERYDLSPADMSSRKRPARIAFPRQIAMYLCREMTAHSLVEVGDAFGRRDHATVIHACKKVEEACAKDATVSAAVEALAASLKH